MSDSPADGHPLRLVYDAVRDDRAERREFERHTSGEIAGIRERVASLEKEDRHVAEELARECSTSARCETAIEQIPDLREASEAMATWLAFVRWCRWAGKTARWCGVPAGKFVALPSALVALILMVLKLIDAL